jgi:hypothetical protein
MLERIDVIMNEVLEAITFILVYTSVFSGKLYLPFVIFSEQEMMGKIRKIY